MDLKQVEAEYWVENQQNLKEMHHFPIEGRFSDFMLPLMVLGLGNGVWREDVAVHKNNVSQFFIEIITAGNMTAIKGKKEYLIEPGMVFLTHIGTNLILRTGPAGFVHKRYIGMAGSMLTGMLVTLGIDRIDVCKITRPDVFSNLMRSSIRLIRNGDIGSFLQLASNAYALLLEIAYNVVRSDYPPVIEKALECIYSNVAGTVTVHEIAVKAGVSVAQLYRIFEQQLHKTPMQILTEVKMNNAAMLISRTKLSFKEIMHRVGFEEQSYFTKVFQKIIGSTPSEYRAQHGK